MKNNIFIKRLIFWTIVFLSLSILVFFLAIMLFSYKDFKNIEWNNLINALNAHTKQILTIEFTFPILLTTTLCIFYFFVWKKPSQKAQIKRAVGKTDFGNADFLINEKTQKNLSNFEKCFPLKTEFNEVGWVVKSALVNEVTKFWISSTDQNGHHCLVIGATSSGKTQKTILQSIAYNARIKDASKQPSMVIFDPKGEIANLQLGTLKNNGYEILIFNLRDTFKSSCWNPLYLPTRIYFEGQLLKIKTLEKETYYKNLINQLEKELEINSNKEMLDKLIQTKLELADLSTQNSISISKITECDEIVNDIALALYQSKEKDKFWDEQAKSTFLSVYYLMIEAIEKQFLENKKYDEIDLKQLEKEYSKINLPSIAVELTNVKDIQKYFEFVNNISDIEVQTKYKSKKSYINGSSPFSTSENTLGSIIAVANAGLEQYKQATIQNITTKNEIVLDKLSTKDKPVALFLIVPDEKETSYKFATLLIDQIYKANISLASSLPNQKLERPLMFYLDEFGNIPTIPKFDTMITVSRSRKIFFCIAIQGFNQIDTKYGKDQAKTIIENMLLHIFVSTADQDTINYYQKRAGNYTIYKIGTSRNLGTSKQPSSETSSTNLEKKELLTLEDIKNNPNDMLLIFYQNLNVAWVKTKAFYQCADLQNQLNLDTFFGGSRIFEFKDNYFNVLNFWNQNILQLEKEANYQNLFELINQSFVSQKRRIDLFEKIIQNPLYKLEDNLKINNYETILNLYNKTQEQLAQNDLVNKEKELIKRKPIIPPLLQKRIQLEGTKEELKFDIEENKDLDNGKNIIENVNEEINSNPSKESLSVKEKLALLENNNDEK